MIAPKLRWYPFVLLLAGLWASVCFTAAVASARTITLSLELGRIQYSVLNSYNGQTYYTVNVLVYSDIPPVTYDEVSSPGALYGGSEYGYGDSYFNDVASAVNSATNGVWTLTVNQGDVSEKQYTFTVSASGLSNGSLPAVAITAPADGATGVSTNTVFSWAGPGTWSSLDLLDHILDYSFYAPYSPAPATTTWATAPFLPPGTNEFEVTYKTNGAAWFTISVPVDNLANPFTNWVGGSKLFVTGQSGFVVSTNATGVAPFRDGHTIVAHYTFDDNTVYTADVSGKGNNIAGSSGNGGAAANYTTNDAAAGPYAAYFFAPQNPDFTYSASWLIPPTNLLTTLAGSFTASLWLKTSDAFAFDSSPGSDGEGLLTADYTIIFTNGINYGAPGDVVPMALTGHKLAFLTGDNLGGGDDTLHSSANIDNGAYVHLVVTRDQVTGEKKIYVNGQLDASDFGSSATLNTPQQLIIGAQQLVPMGGSLFSPVHGINGDLDDIQIYSGVLATNDVAYLFSHPGSTVADVVGNIEDPLAVALNAPELVWSTSGNAAWFPETATNNDGLSAAQSGVIDVGQSSTLQTTITNGTGAASVSFEWQTVDDDGDFYLNFYIDGQQQDQKSGTVSWTPSGPYFLGPGTHTLQWVASADNTGFDSPTNDAGWVDQVRLTPVPLVQATASPTVGESPLAVHFTAPAVDTLGNAITSWNWIFGDGSGSSVQNPTHTYTTVGTFSPTLSTITASGATPLTIGPGLINATIAYSNIVHATGSPTVGQAPLTVQFSAPTADSRGKAITKWTWTFGDGYGSSAQNPSHTYNYVGSFQPRLTTLNTNGATPRTVGPEAITATLLSPSNAVKNLPGSPVGFTFHNFKNTKSLQLLGNATNVTTSDGAVLQLTPSTSGQAGAAFTAVPIPFGPHVGFSTFFTFRLSKPGGFVDSDGVQGGDGIAFLIQSAGYMYGVGGGGIGYEGINQSLAVEFDTWNNFTQNGFPGDLNGNQVAVNLNGVLNDPVSVPITNAMNNGNVWYAWVDYEGVSQDLQVRLSEIPIRPKAPILDVTVDLPSILGTTNAFVGFTSGTGAAYNQQDILSWKFMALPTTRVTGTFNLTNVPHGFRINKGIVLARYKYSVAGITYTNYNFVPIDTISNINSKFAFATKMAELNKASALPNPDAVDLALSNNAAAIDAKDFMTYAVLATYTNADLNTEGAVMNTYNDGTGFPEFLQNADYSTRYVGYESDYLNKIYDMNQNSYPGLNPDVNTITLAETGARLGAQVAQLLASMDADGNYGCYSIEYSLGTELGTMTASQQVVYSPPLPLVIISPRSDGTNFVFDFGTVSNQSYTVWANSNLATTNWVGYTNLLGDGYFQKITIPLTNSPRSFYQLSSP